jgi:hypothetical protein
MEAIPSLNSFYAQNISKTDQIWSDPNRRASVSAVDPQTLSVERPPTANAAPRRSFISFRKPGYPRYLGRCALR